MGGANSHTAILARSLNIPSIVAVRNAKKLIKAQGIKFKGLERVQNKVKDFLNKKMDLEALNKSTVRQIEGIEFYFENGQLKDGNKPIVDDETLRNQQEELRKQIEENVIECERIEAEDLTQWRDLVQKMLQVKKDNKDEVPEPIDDTTPFKTLDTDESARATEIEFRELVKEFHIEEVVKSRDRKSFAEAEEGSIVGDTVGDPLKDTSGPSLNILIKLSLLPQLFSEESF